jgi:hypothetical protein
MGTAQAIFAVERCGGATGSHVTGSDVTGRDVNHVSCQKYVLRMLNERINTVFALVLGYPPVGSPMGIPVSGCVGRDPSALFTT